MQGEAAIAASAADNKHCGKLSRQRSYSSLPTLIAVHISFTQSGESAWDSKRVNLSFVTPSATTRAMILQALLPLRPSRVDWLIATGNFQMKTSDPGYWQNVKMDIHKLQGNHRMETPYSIYTTCASAENAY